MLKNIFSELIVKCNDHDKLRNFCRMSAESQSADEIFLHQHTDATCGKWGGFVLKKFGLKPVLVVVDLLLSSEHMPLTQLDQREKLCQLRYSQCTCP